MRFLHVLEELKCRTRHGWTHTNRHESVAEHSFRLCCMALLLRDSLPGVDMDKVLRLCVIHDWGEAITGDIPTFEKTGEDENEERRAIKGLCAMLPDKRTELEALFAELDAQQTHEARVCKALDRLEAVIQHNEAPLDTWIELERTLNLTYGTPECEPYPPLKALRDLAAQETLEKLQA